MHRIVFVCTANTCRSPLAEGLFCQLATNRGVSIEIKSAGIHAYPGTPMSQHSAYLLRERGVDADFQSQRIDEQLVAWADLILTMTQGHKIEILRRFPESANKCFTLKEYVLFDHQLAAIMQQMDSIYADIEIQFSLGQAVTDEQRQTLRELERQLPNFDIADPYAGSIDHYRECSLEIEYHLKLLLDKLQK